MHAKKRFGQNFLHDRHMIDKILFHICPKANDIIVEVGPGHGAITKPLLASGCYLHAIEIDDDLINLLPQKIHSEQFKLHHADALLFDLSQISPHFRLVGNLPYNISTPLLFHMMQYTDHIIDMHVMLQREVVDRIVAEPNSKTYGRLSVMLQYYCDVHRLFLIPPGVFDPAPKVDSAFLRLIPKKSRPLNKTQERDLEACVKLAFAQRRKTIKNNLKTIIPEQYWEKINIDPTKRAENLTIEEFILLSKTLSLGKTWLLTQ